MKVGWVMAALVVTAWAAAGATTYMDERFEGSVPPAGWMQSGYNGSWGSGGGGPYGNYASGSALANWPNSGGATLWSPVLPFPAGRTLYYRFYQYGSHNYFSGVGYARFYIRNAPGTADLINRQWPTPFNWREVGGEGVINAAGGVYVVLQVSAPLYGHYGGGVSFYVDTLQIGDEPFTAVAPASLGRVKSLFH